MEVEKKIPSSSIIKLNIGGIKYITTKGTLVNGNIGFFVSLLSGDFAAPVDEKGYYFIDRDGKYFEPILEYLRTGELNVPKHLSRKNVARESKFYNIDIPPLASLTSNHISAPQPRLDGIYTTMEPDKNMFYVFGLEGKGFCSVQLKDKTEFKWKMSSEALIELVFASKNEITYNEGVIFKQKRDILLFDDGFLFNTEGNKLEFFEAGSFLSGVLYRPSKQLQFSAKESVHGILFNTPKNEYEETKRKVSFLWKFEENFNWADFFFEESHFFGVSSISVGLSWTSSRVELIPLGNMLLASKASKDQIPHAFEKFTMVDKD